MPTIPIIHPVHGKWHVFDLADLERHKKLGWSVIEENQEKQPEVALESSPTVEPEKTEHAESAPAKARRGRPRKVI